MKILPIAFVAVALVLVGASGYLYYEYYGKPRCEACGMIITPEMDANFQITDTSSNKELHACCAGCALRLVAAHPDIHIEALDSWYGSPVKAVIDIRGGNVSSVSPNSTVIILGSKISGGCASNRIAVNETSAQLLVQNGYSSTNPLTVFRTAVPEGAPVLSIAQALTPLKEKGIQYVPPSPVFVGSIAVAGIAVLLIGVVAWKKLLPAPVNKT